jgi:hypothetical protein
MAEDSLLLLPGHRVPQFNEVSVGHVGRNEAFFKKGDAAVRQLNGLHWSHSLKVFLHSLHDRHSDVALLCEAAYNPRRCRHAGDSTTRKLIMRLSQYAKHHVKGRVLFVVQNGLFFYADNDLWSPWVHHAQAFDSEDVACMVANAITEALTDGNEDTLSDKAYCDLVAVHWFDGGWMIDDGVVWDREEEYFTLTYGDGEKWSWELGEEIQVDDETFHAELCESEVAA